MDDFKAHRAGLVLETLTILLGLTRVFTTDRDGLVWVHLIDAEGARYGAKSIVCAIETLADGTAVARFSNSRGDYVDEAGRAEDALLALTIPAVAEAAERKAFLLADDERALRRWLDSVAPADRYSGVA